MSAAMHLNLFVLGVGHHEAAWRLPDAPAGGTTDVAFYAGLCRRAEAAALDSVFFADRLALPPSARYNAVESLEPLTLLAALAAQTEQIGLIGTVSTTFSEPYTVARQLATLDHISGGRVGWNIVTSIDPAAARNYGRDFPDHAARYARAAEFTDVALKLWDGWKPGARIDDRERGIYVDDARVRPAAHAGTHFEVAGALNVPRSPQGRPLLVQAGSSEDGRALASRYADAVFTAQQTLDGAVAFREDIRARAGAHGRDPDRVVVLPGICPVIGATEAEARERAEELDGLIVTEYALHQLREFLGVDLSGHPLDAPLPPLPAADGIETHKSRFALIVELAQREQLTLRQLIARMGGGRGHRVIAGAPEQIADELEAWFRAGAADGFNVMPPALPRDGVAFLDRVVPELQRRGLFRSEYGETSLRARYGVGD
ncbi:LLM class flavin-dependent oxidoreductase [Conexibacter sp. JD483]|uniref:LLM class flavin-dependent oxidoreductase n=1 Tax=unclassified Conexibacter TaxID=2627773 RepID=UPI00271CB313|nr:MULTISPECIES: LLM class flavin-dependent oxidoreductase [unclassified Conexibacter]MDO8188627.1 LLM class flavin-dependent oxidoreductase [Conexibacter sp. CPCC 205706]MDO8201537.1 LLM class flavin-dependent oxidoreductase [Conexibacter sp. CPCC 205762]MDR9370756.1 LLM class flavin-dependent oxidoreductase [Conexibacter sp. JD483]